MNNQVASIINPFIRFLFGKRADSHFGAVAVTLLIVGLIAGALYRMVPAITNLIDSGISMLGG